MLILGLSPTSHDATACLFDDYRLLAAVSQETADPSQGRWRPCSARSDRGMPGDRRVRHDQVDAVVTNRSLFPERYYRHFTGYRRAKAVCAGRSASKSRDISMSNAIAMAGPMRWRCSMRPASWPITAFARIADLPSPITIWPTRCPAFSIPTGRRRCSIRRTARATMRSIRSASSRRQAGDAVSAAMRRCSRRRKVDGLGEVYGHGDGGVGLHQRNRHEGKLTGLAAYGKPVFYEAMAAHFRVDDKRLRSERFSRLCGDGRFIAGPCKRVSARGYRRLGPAVAGEFHPQGGRAPILTAPSAPLPGRCRRRLRQCAAEPAPGGGIAGGGDLRLPRHGRSGPGLMAMCWNYLLRRDGMETLARPALSHRDALLRPRFRRGYR